MFGLDYNDTKTSPFFEFSEGVLEVLTGLRIETFEVTRRRSVEGGPKKEELHERMVHLGKYLSVREGP